MKLNELQPTKGSRKKAWRVGRGAGSGNGKTSARGQKGQKSRSGGSVPLYFEGGQMPLYRRIPKRGFTNARFKKVYLEVNVSDLNRFNDGDIVDLKTVHDIGIVKATQAHDGLKVLGRGDLNKKLTVKAAAITAGAKAKIEEAGGTVEEV